MKSFLKKIGGAFVSAWNFVKNIPWASTVKPLVSWCVFGGALAVSTALMLIFWL